MVAVNALTVQETRFVYSTSGVDETRAKVDNLAKSQGTLAKSSDAAAASNDRVEKGARGASDAYGKLGSASADAARMQAVLERAQRQIQASMMQAAAGADAYDRSLAGLAEAQMRVAQTAAQANRAANDNVASLQRQGEAYQAAGKFAAEHPLLVLAGSAAAARGLSGLAASASVSLAAASASTARFAAASAEMGSSTAAGAAMAARGLGLASAAASSAAGGLTAYSESVSGLSLTLGLMNRGLSLVPPLLVPIAVGFLAFQTASAFLGKAYDDLARLIELGERAGRLDVGATFLKSFTELGPAIRVSADEMQAALQRASAFVQDRLGQQNGLAKAFGDLSAGGFTGGSALAAEKQLAAARSTEERIRAALAGMAELEARGQRLAALDLSEKVFGPAITERLRFGQTTVAAMIADIERVGSKQLFTDTDAARAVEMSRAIADTKRGIDEAMAATFNFSSVATGLNGVWLSILKTVLAVAEAGNRGIDAVAANRTNGFEVLARQIDAKRQELARLEASNAGSGLDGDDFKTAAAREELARLVASLEAATRAKASFVDARIDAAVGEIAPPARLVSDELARLTAEADNATRTLPGVAGALQGIGGAASAAAAQLASVAAGIRAIQGLNPELSGTLGFIDKVKQVNDTFAATRTKILGEFDTSGNGEEAAKRLNDLLAERSRTLKAITDQQARGATDYVRSGELAQMNDLDRSLAQLGDNYGRVRKERETFYDTLAKQAATPEAAASIRQQGEAEIAKLDVARKALEAKARSDAAQRGAKEAGGGSTGADAFDNALQRTRDQIQEFELQAQTAGRATEEVYKLTEANRLRRAAASAGRGDEAGIAEQIDREATAYARQRKATEDAIEAQRRLQEGQREIASEFGRFADDVLLGGTKIGEAFKNLAKSLSSNALRAVLTGEGPLAGILGTAPTERGQVGGLFGGQIDFKKAFGLDDIGKAVGDGAENGLLRGLAPLLEPRKNAQGQSGGFFTSQLGSGLAAAGAGAAIGYSSQNPLIGAVGGGLSGFAAGAAAGGSMGPIGAVIGAGAGLIGGLLGQDEAKKAAKKRIQEQIKAYKEEYENQRTAITQLAATLRGDSLGGVQAQIDQAHSQTRSAIVTADRGGDQAMVRRLYADFQTFIERVRGQFSAAFEGTLREVAAGLGTNGPFAQAAAAVATLGESLKAFVADAVSITAPASAQQARVAAQQAALASLDPAPTLSATATEIARIQGTAAGLQTVLVQLGLSANDAATAIQSRTAAALDALRSKFNEDVSRKLNDAQGKGYLNEAADLVKEVNQLRQDRAAIGGDAGQVEAYFTAAAQKLVDGASLTGDAFTELTAVFPSLSGRVHEFTGALTDTAAKAAIAARALGYQDRLFAATTDTSTLAGQLAAYDRKAGQEREAEIKAGGEAIVDLEAAQYAERLKIVTDYSAQAAEAEKQRWSAAQTAFASFTKTIEAFVSGMRTGANSPLSPGDRLAAAQTRFDTQLSAAKSGNRDALDSITSNASDLLDAAKAQFASSQGYQDVFAAVEQALSALPKQVSAEQFIVDAINNSRDALTAALRANSPTAVAQALASHFDTLDTSLDGLLDFNEFSAGLGPLATAEEQRQARVIFDALDANGDGQLSRMELANASSGRVEAYTYATKTTIDQSNAQLNRQNQILDALNPVNASQRDILGQVNVWTNATYGNLNQSNAYLNAIMTLNDSVRGANATSNEYLIRMLFNLQAANYRNGAAVYATGGLVEGPGTGTSDSIAARLSNGEFVVTAEAVRRFGVANLDAINDNTFGAQSVAMPVPVPVPGGGIDVGVLVVELKALRAETKAQAEMLGRVMLASGERVAGRVDGVRDEVSAGNADRRRQGKTLTAGRGAKVA